MFFLHDILIIIGLSAVVLYLCHRLQIPVIVGFLVTGLLTGPYGFRLVGDIKAVTELAEIGVIALLFTIGLEFSFKNLLEIRRTALLGGTLQMALTLAAAAAVSYALGQPWQQAVFIGFLTALSSTAIVMKLLQDRAEVESPQGVNALGILIYQDLIVVPMMILLPFLGGTAQVSQENILLMLAKSAGVVLFTIAATRWVVPWILHRVTQTQSRELFLLTTVFICLAVASLTYAAGLSLALGAFLAGLVISDEYSHQAMGDILPFRDIFASFFFVSVGMLLDLGFLVRNPAYILTIAGGIMFLKALVATGSSLVVGLPLRASVLVGLAICQIGEFSFILAETGKSQGLLSVDLYQEFLALSVLTMMATPFLFRFSPRIAEALTRLPLPRRWKRGTSHVHGAKRFHEKDHLVIIGFGMTGRNIAKAARETKIPYAVLDMNPDRVRDEREKGEPIFYGDATHEAVLDTREHPPGPDAGHRDQRRRGRQEDHHDRQASQRQASHHRPDPVSRRDRAPHGPRRERGHPRGIRSLRGDLQPDSLAIPYSGGRDPPLRGRDPVGRLRHVPESLEARHIVPEYRGLHARHGPALASCPRDIPPGRENDRRGKTGEPIRSHGTGREARCGDLFHPAGGPRSSTGGHPLHCRPAREDHGTRDGSPGREVVTGSEEEQKIGSQEDASRRRTRAVRVGR